MSSAVLDVGSSAHTEALTTQLGVVQRFAERAGDAENVAGMVDQFLVPESESIITQVALFPEMLAKAWKQLLEEGWAGRVSEVHTARESLAHDCQLKLSLIEKARHVGALTAQLSGKPFTDEFKLQHAQAKLLLFKSEILDRWGTIEDLEDLLAACYPLSNDRLRELAARHPPPFSWYQEVSKPF